MSEEEGGAEDVSFLRTEDMVSLSCTGTGERVCLSAEGFGNRQCFLESIADKVTGLYTGFSRQMNVGFFSRRKIDR